MSIPIKDIDFSALPESERLLLAEALLDSLTGANDVSVPPEHIAEINRRIADADAGRIHPMTREELRTKLPQWGE